MKKLIIGILLIFCFFVFSCTSVPNANARKKTLVIGQIILEVKELRASSPSLVGTHKQGIEIIIENIESGKSYSLKSQKNGLFYSTGLKAGNYKISRVIFKKSSGPTSTGIGWSPQRDFIVEEGYVNNMGVLEWISSNRTATFSGNQKFIEVREYFQNNFSSSNWNEYEWLNTK